MPDYQDLIELVRGPRGRIMPAIWDFFPCHATAVGGVPSFVRYYFDVDEKLRIQQRFCDLIPEALILPGVFPDLGVVVEVSAFGGRIQWFQDGAPYIGDVIHDPRDIDSLTLPEPGLAGLMPLQLTQRQVMQASMRERGLDMGRWVMSMGPAEISGLLMGYERFYLAMYDDPDRVKKLMWLVTELIVKWLHRQEEVVGPAELLCVADHVCSQVTAEQLREFIVPCMQAIYGEFPEPVTFYHNEGRHSDRHIELVLSFGAEVWHFGSDVHPLGDVLDRVDGRIVLFGGLDPHGAMRHGTPADVRTETRAALAAARRHWSTSGSTSTRLRGACSTR